MRTTPNAVERISSPDVLVEHGFWGKVGELDTGQEVYETTDAGIAALEAGNLG